MELGLIIGFVIGMILGYILKIAKIKLDGMCTPSNEYRSFLYLLENENMSSEELTEEFKEYFKTKLGSKKESKGDVHLVMDHKDGFGYYLCGQSIDRIVGEETKDIYKVTCKKCLKISRKQERDLFPSSRY